MMDNKLLITSLVFILLFSFSVSSTPYNMLQNWSGGAGLNFSGTIGLEDGVDDGYNPLNICFLNETNLFTEEQNFTKNITAYDIVIPRMYLNDKYKSLNDAFKLFNSAGQLTGGEINNESGTYINVSSGHGVMRVADDDTSQLKFIKWDARTNILVPTDTLMYLGVDYNSGNPIVVNKSSNTWNYDTNFPLGSVINLKGNLYLLDLPWQTGDAMTNVLEWLESQGPQRDERVRGLILGNTGTRNPTLTQGNILYVGGEFPITSKDCSTTDKFFQYYRDGSGSWNRQGPFTQWNNTHYDPGTGTLQEMLPNKYANIWVFIQIDADNNGQLMLIFPQQTYSSIAAAEAGTVPAFPTSWYEHGILVGRILFKKSTNTPIEVQSTFTTQLTPTQATDHGNLGGLTDDDHTQYLLISGLRNQTNLNVTGKICTSEGCSDEWVSTMDYTNLSFVNESNIFTQKQYVNGDILINNGINVSLSDNCAFLVNNKTNGDWHFCVNDGGVLNCELLWLDGGNSYVGINGRPLKPFTINQTIDDSAMRFLGAQDISDEWADIHMDGGGDLNIVTKESKIELRPGIGGYIDMFKDANTIYTYLMRSPVSGWAGQSITDTGDYQFSISASEDNYYWYDGNFQNVIMALTGTGGHLDVTGNITADSLMGRLHCSNITGATSDLCSIASSGGSMDYTNLALTNESNRFTEEQIVDTLNTTTKFNIVNATITGNTAAGYSRLIFEPNRNKAGENTSMLFRLTAQGTPTYDTMGFDNIGAWLSLTSGDYNPAPSDMANLEIIASENKHGIVSRQLGSEEANDIYIGKALVNTFYPLISLDVSEDNVGISQLDTNPVPDDVLHVSSPTDAMVLIEMDSSDVNRFAGINFKVSTDDTDNYIKAGMAFVRKNFPASTQGEVVIGLDDTGSGSWTPLTDRQFVLGYGGNLSITGNLTAENVMSNDYYTGGTKGATQDIYINSTCVLSFVGGIYTGGCP